MSSADLEPDDPDRRQFGNLVAVNTHRAIRNQGNVPDLSREQLTECSELISRLREQYQRMFADKKRIEGATMRIDQQSFFPSGNREYSNTAIQNNTEAGARGRANSHSYACVVVDTRAVNDPNVADALIWAFGQSLTSRTTWQIDLVSEPVRAAVAAPATEVFTCPACNHAVTMFSDSIERGRTQGTYPPHDRCPRCKEGVLKR
ncbi:MAG: hypothetical protein U0790_06365 [Isosphaeraceae bacterium]